MTLPKLSAEPIAESTAPIAVPSVRPVSKPGSKPRRKSWRRAIRALRALLADAEQTQLATVVIDELDGGSHECGLRRMLNEPEGRSVFAERPSLRAILCDREAMEKLPEGSFGRAYLEHLDRFDLDPEKLIEINEAHFGERQEDPAVCWFAERSQLLHDLWHVLTGYGADHLGESALLAFSYAQQGGQGRLILTLGANLRMTSELGPRWLLTVWRSWRRAVCLEAQPYESLLALPLSEARRLFNIEPPECVHTEGLRTGNLQEARALA